jgi:hypothetical protein
VEDEETGDDEETCVCVVLDRCRAESEAGDEKEEMERC